MADEIEDAPMAKRGWLYMTRDDIGDAPPAMVLREAFDQAWGLQGWVEITSRTLPPESATEGSSSDSSPAKSKGSVPTLKSKED